MVESEPPKSVDDVVRRGVAVVEARLPEGWQVWRRGGIGEETGVRVELSDRSGQSAMLVVEARQIVQGRDVGPLRERFETSAAGRAESGLVMARYLSPPVRARLVEAGLSYVDCTGNVRIEVGRPGLFLADRGADRDPWRGPGRPRGTLTGEPAAKIVRTLADVPGRWSVRELVERSKASTGAAYRVVEFLEREGLAVRDDDGRVVVPDWAHLLRCWSDDYGFVRSNQITRWIAPRGIPALVDRIGTTDRALRYAVTGSLAAAEWASYAPASAALVYVADVEAAVDAWDLRPADAGANVLLAQPSYAVVFERSVTTDDGVTIAAPTQVVVDLMTGPGRNPSEADVLLAWMGRHEERWRSR